MNFKEFISNIRGDSPRIDSFDDVTITKEEQSTILEESRKILTSESFTTNQVVRTIRNLTDEKITIGIVEHYKTVASSKELTNDQIALNIRLEDANKIFDNHIFILESGELVGISSNDLDSLIELNNQELHKCRQSADSLKSELRKKNK